MLWDAPSTPGDGTSIPALGPDPSGAWCRFLGRPDWRREEGRPRAISNGGARIRLRTSAQPDTYRAAQARRGGSSSRWGMSPNESRAKRAPPSIIRQLGSDSRHASRPLSRERPPGFWGDGRGVSGHRYQAEASGRPEGPAARHGGGSRSARPVSTRSGSPRRAQPPPHRRRRRQMEA